MFVLLSLTTVAQEVLSPLLSRQMCPLGGQKTAPASASLPLFDDFAKGLPASDLWQQGGGAEVTLDVSPLAPTVGVLTLDALDAGGSLYAVATSSPFPADTACSLPIRLESLTPADSVVLSFYYLPGGGYGNMWERVGYTPDAKDSLFLDFYNPQDSVWRTVWRRGGISADTLMARTGHAWQYVAVAVTDSAYFDSTFRFRFRNHASLESTPKAGKAGNCDYWHIDYVMMDSARTVTAEPDVHDIAFAAPASTVLKHYRAMPYRQYRPAEMADAFKMYITNRYSSELASHYTYSVLDSLGTELYAYDGGFRNAPPFMPDGTYQTAAGHAAAPVEFSFPSMTAPTEYTVLHVVREGAAGDDYPWNDTLKCSVSFAEYYAYDDGSPENGYSLTSTAATMSLAYRFNLNVEDTLTAVDMYFNSTHNDANGNISFYLTLWSVGTDGRPDRVLYRDQTRRKPRTGGFHRYVLERQVAVAGGLFVGFEQSGNDFINLGFDRSLNTAERIYQLTDSAWKQSILSGSLMLRPCFGQAATEGIAGVESSWGMVCIYPNPASAQVFIEGDFLLTELFDFQGRCVGKTQSGQMDVEDLPDGLYLLKVVSKTGNVHVEKLIIRH